MNHRSRIPRALTHLVAALAITPGFVCAQMPALKNDPFVRPMLRGVPAPVDPGVPSAPPVATAPVASWNPELTALLRAGKDSMVKVGGVMLRVGEVIDGHRLVEVREGEAVFIALENRKRVVLPLSGREWLRAPAFQEEDRPKERLDDSKEGPGK